MNKYDELLLKFTTESGGLADKFRTDNPLRDKDNQTLVFATNGHIACYVPVANCERPYDISPRLKASSILTTLEKYENKHEIDITQSLERLNYAIENKKLEFLACNSCVSEWDDDSAAHQCPRCEFVHVCWSCNGTRLSKQPATPAFFLNNPFNFLYLKKTFEAIAEFNQGKCTVYEGAEKTPYIFSFAEIKIAVMCMLRSANNGQYYAI